MRSNLYCLQPGRKNCIRMQDKELGEYCSRLQCCEARLRYPGLCIIIHAVMCTYASLLPAVVSYIEDSCGAGREECICPKYVTVYPPKHPKAVSDDPFHVIVYI